MSYAQLLANICIIVNFQLRSSINAGLTIIYISIIGFALKGPPKWVFWGILGAGAKIFGGKRPRNAITADLRRLVKQEAQQSLTNRALLVCKVIEVWQDFLSEYVDKKFTYICYRRLIRHE